MKSAKAAMRHAMARSRDVKIAEAREFIERMENPSHLATASESIGRLVLSGNELHKALVPAIRANSDEERLEALRGAIQPYLQLVRGDERCEFTGHKLGDIWRYFRYTWSIAAESTPGRTLRYLIRDAAQPFHPIIGISSLENAVIRSPDRDHFIGWSTRYIGAEILTAEKEGKKGTCNIYQTVGLHRKCD